MNSVDTPLMTIKDANRRLPLIRAIVRDIIRQTEQLQSRRTRFDELQAHETASQSEQEACAAELNRDVERLEDLVDELTELQVTLKDPLLGHVDFPAIRDGRRVNLCWVPPEDDVSHWHEVDASCDDRRSIYEIVNK